MRQIDIASQVEHLRRLAGDFEALHTHVRDLTYTPGTDALDKISPVLLNVQDLTAKAVLRLWILDGSQYTTVQGSRSSLETLASVVSSALLAGTDLAGALYANPYEGAAFAGQLVDEGAVRKARHAEATPVMAEHIADAAHQLDLRATACHFVASGISRDLAAAICTTAVPSQQQEAPQKLSARQYAALQALAKGGGQVRETHHRGSTRVYTKDGTRVTIATFQSLHKGGLVRLDTGTALYQGRDITVTGEGQRALAHHRPGTALTTTPAPAPPAVAATSGVRR